jgi:hypothetical protein
LADKELAVLAAEVASHSSRLLPLRKLHARHIGIWARGSADADGSAAAPDRRISGRFAGKREDQNVVRFELGGPAGRDVLLAACRSSETAKEVNEGGKSHGDRDLLKRVETQVRLRVSQQVLQVEASNPAALLQPFLGGAIRSQQVPFTLSFDREPKNPPGCSRHLPMSRPLLWLMDPSGENGVSRSLTNTKGDSGASR